jgi:hypothetical protein
VIYEHGKQWWNDIDRENMISPPQLWKSYQENYLVTKQEELAKEIILPQEVSL